MYIILLNYWRKGDLKSEIIISIRSCQYSRSYYIDVVEIGTPVIINEGLKAVNR